MERSITYFNISWLSKTDGPGKRLVLFLQGCPLNCSWCHSPHSQQPVSPLLYFDSLCLQCQICKKTCENGVHVFSQGHHTLRRENCTQCGACVSACPQSSTYYPSGPLSLPTKRMEVTKLFDLLGPQLELLKKDGGITFSGGEPLLQSEALTQLAKLCKEAGYHTALETSGIVPLAAIERIHPFIDTWLIGMRLVTSDDPAERNHLEKYTRQTMNYLKHSDVLVRIPVIPGFTTTEYYLTLTRQILEDYRQAHIEILPMNPETAHYYQAIGQTSGITYDESQAARLYEYVCEFLNIKTLNKQV